MSTPLAESSPRSKRSTPTLTASRTSSPLRKHATIAGAADTRKILPYSFLDAEDDDLILLISDMLTKLMKHNDQVPIAQGGLTRFHSRAPPSISVVEYLRRIVKYTNVEKAPLLVILHYIDTFSLNHPSYTLSSLTVHRFLITAVCVAAKAYSDVFCTNAHYAKVGGIKVTELNMLERELLKGLKWQLVCDPTLLYRYYSSLIVSYNIFVQAAPPPPEPSSSTIPPPKPRQWFIPSQSPSSPSSSTSVSMVLSPLSTSTKRKRLQGQLGEEMEGVEQAGVDDYIVSSSMENQQGFDGQKEHDGEGASEEGEDAPPQSKTPRVNSTSTFGSSDRSDKEKLEAEGVTGVG